MDDRGCWRGYWGPSPDGEPARKARAELAEDRFRRGRLRELAAIEAWNLAFPGCPDPELIAWCELWRSLRSP